MQKDKVDLYKKFKSIAKRKGGELLSREYIDAKTPLLWRCRYGHEWMATPSKITQGRWCHTCGGSKKKSIEEMSSLAEEYGGKCLSEEYVDNQTKLLWECSRGHQWEASLAVIQKSNWCPYCNGRKTNLKELQEYAKDKGGTCLSKEVTNKSMKLKWECAKGHRWYANASNILRGHWCPYCSGRKGDFFKEVSEIARLNGGRCLSKQYVNSTTKMRFRCSKGHEWEAVPVSIKSENWCPYCSGRKGDFIGRARSIAKERKGRCLSKKFESAKSMMKWKCSKGHTWEMSFDKVQRGQWCPRCSAGFGERVCRIYFETIFKTSFDKAYPDWLYRKEGDPREIDGLSISLGVAFEHNGIQHYKFSKKFHKTPDDLILQKKKDSLRRRRCKANGIKLIEIKEINHRDGIRLDNLIDYLVSEFNRLGIPYPKRIRDLDFDLSEVYSPDFIKEGQALAKARGGKCLSKVYLGANSSLEWKCKEGHCWAATLYRIKKGHWCPTCGARRSADKRRFSMEKVKEIAAEKGIKCLSKKYIRHADKLLWECPHGHQWYASLANIMGNRGKSGTGCPKCSRRSAGHKL